MNIFLTIAVAILGYIFAKKVNLPIPAMIGSLLFVSIFNIIFDKAYMPSTIKMFTQGISGVFIGQQMSDNKLKDYKDMAKPLILLLFMFTINTFTVGILIFKLFDMDMVTSLLSSVSGGVADMSLISIDMNANPSTVALMQSSRLLFTLSFFPSWIIFLTKDDDENTKNTKIESIETNVVMYKLAITIGICFIASYIGKITNIPAGPLIVSAIVTAFLNKYTSIINTKKSIKTISQLFAGSLVATTIDKATFLNMPKLIGPILILIAFYLIVNYIFGYICFKLKWLDKKSALFASCPAGVSDMALIASDIGADLSQVGVLQVARLVYSISIMPQLILLFMSLNLL